MARSQKQGLDYFALDVNMNDEVDLIEAEHGVEGFAILIKLFQKIYSEQSKVKQEQHQQSKIKTRFHLAKSSGDKYTSDELEELI